MITADDQGLPPELDPCVQRLTGWTVHGNLPFDVPVITRVLEPAGPGRPAIYQGGVRDGLMLPGSIRHVISLYLGEEYDVFHVLTTHVRVCMRDSADQALFDVGPLARLAADLYTYCAGDILIHCQAGLNRSGLVTAMALRALGWDAETAISHLRRVRSPAVLCNAAFEKHVRGHG